LKKELDAMASSRIKDRLKNRFHVGNEVWPVFSEVTSMSLFGRSVLVVGYGPVGKGIAAEGD
jgi:adenosylhomocysteinase